MRLEPTTTLYINEHSTIYPNWPNDLAVLGVLICTVHLTVCSYHVTHVFQSESTLYSCLNVKEFLALSRHKICSFLACDWTRTHNHWVHKRTLYHFAIMAKWLRCVVSTYLYAAFDCMFLTCQVCVSEWIRSKYSQPSSMIWPIGPKGWVFVYELSGSGFESSCSHLNFIFQTALHKEFFDIQATIECGFTLKWVRHMIRTYNEMHRTDKYSQHSSIIWPFWLNG